MMIDEQSERIDTEEPKIDPQAKIEPRKHDEAPIKANRAQRRQIAASVRRSTMEKRRHDIKHDPEVWTRETAKRMTLCPVCNLDFFGSALVRCQCKIIRPMENK